MTESEFLEYILPYGIHVSHVFGVESSAKECANLIKTYKRDNKLKSILKKD